MKDFQKMTESNEIENDLAYNYQLHFHETFLLHLNHNKDLMDYKFYCFLMSEDQYHSKLGRLFHVRQNLKTLIMFYFFYMKAEENKILNLMRLYQCIRQNLFLKVYPKIR